MKIERKRTRAAEVYTASLNDIMFFLLLFFLIVSTMVAPAALKVLLPNANSADKVATKKSIMLVVTDDGQYYIDDRHVTFDQIEPALASMVKDAERSKVEYTVSLQADKSQNLQKVVDLIDIVNKLHLKMVLLVKKN